MNPFFLVYPLTYKFKGICITLNQKLNFKCLVNKCIVIKNKYIFLNFLLVQRDAMDYPGDNADKVFYLYIYEEIIGTLLFIR